MPKKEGKYIELSGADQVVVMLKDIYGSWSKLESFIKSRKNVPDYPVKDWLRGIKAIRNFERKHKVRFAYNGYEDKCYYKEIRRDKIKTQA